MTINQKELEQRTIEAVNNPNTKSANTYLEYGVTRYYFDIVSRESIETQTKTTDHYLENGSLIQDHAVDLPMYYTLSGFVAEKTHTYTGEPKADLYVKRAMMQDSLRRFQTLAQISPTLSNYVYSAINTGRFVAGRVTNLIKSTQGFFKTTFITDKIRTKFEELPEYVTGLYGYTQKELKQSKADKAGINTPSNRFVTEKQSYVYGELEKLRVGHKLLTLHHPWGANSQVIIESINCSQDVSWSISDITITLKHLNFVEAKSNIPEVNPFDPASQKSDLIKNGEVIPKPSTETEFHRRPDGSVYYINDFGDEIDTK